MRHLKEYESILILWDLNASPPQTGPVAGTMTRSGKVQRVILDNKYRKYYIPKSKDSVNESTVGGN